MNRTRLLAHCWFAGTLLLGILGMLLPLPQVLEAFKPYWPALVLLYWILADDKRVTLGLAFALGLGIDLLNSVLLGEQALRLTLLAFIALRFRWQLRFFPFWQQALVVLVLLLNDRLVQLLVRISSAHEPLPPLAWWLSPFVGAVLWPFLYSLLNDLRSRLRLQ